MHFLVVVVVVGVVKKWPIKTHWYFYYVCSWVWRRQYTCTHKSV